MRIALVTWSPRRVAGVEEYVSLVIPAMHAAGHQVALWHEVDGSHDRQPIHLPPGVPRFSAEQLGVDAALRALSFWAPDIVYVQGLRDVKTEAKVLEIAPAVLFLHTYSGTCISGSKTFARPALMPCDRRFGVPCLVNFFPRGCGGNSPVTMWKLFNRESERLQLLGRYRSIVTHSHHMRDEMEKHGLHASVIPFPVEAHTIDEMAAVQDTWHLLFAGRMHYLKGGLLLLDALADVTARSGRAIRVTFAGDGPDRPEWEARGRRLQSRTPDLLTIEFTGWLTQQQIGELLSRVHLLVVPSVWPEPLGSVGPAAAQHGIPAAAFAVGGIPEWLVDGVSGHLAPATPPTAARLGEAIVRCLNDPKHYAELRGGAREIAAKFTMTRHLPALVGAFERATQ